MDNNQVQPMPQPMSQSMPQPISQPQQASSQPHKVNLPAIILGVTTTLGVIAAIVFAILWANAETTDNAPQSVEPTNSESPANTPATTQDSANYIYIGEWGYKIKVPDNLHYVSHKYTVQNDEVSSLGIYGVLDADILYDFANPDATDGYSSTPSPLGFVQRIAKGTYNTTDYPEAIFTDSEYAYIYEHPQALWSTKSNESAIEQKSVESIRQMLTTQSNYSRI